MKATLLLLRQNFYGGDLTSMYADSLHSCTQFCVDNTDYVAILFVGGSGAGHCYLKSKKNGRTENENVDGMFDAVLWLGMTLTNHHRRLFGYSASVDFLYSRRGVDDCFNSRCISILAVYLHRND
ncbi:uncharacterized protein M421DRAFT_91849 [Didymella exigua CBS 183.55]|uniref:Apple domain-containing protein n=1 Tax=Didymella exigua CBS 183.55 TaxID=1150837 RepID=A0A6A5RSR5_9PLEO|nr:uncharacterized protein M421DRAFT_91849 [Didymella exigua CBS 183.55]KAF1929386.1 hypothetical protein M421DRAFT_91849 [Didymella exigua CBS 183.55]